MRVLRIWSQSGGQLYIKAAKEGYLASARSMRRCARELLRVLTSTLPSSARCIQREAGLRRAPKWSVTWKSRPPPRPPCPLQSPDTPAFSPAHQGSTPLHVV